MSCGSCGTNSGCGSNGSCSSGGCNKKSVYDWLGDMGISTSEPYPFAEVRFNNGRKEYCSVPEELDLKTGKAVKVEMASGYHIGYVSLLGELVRLQIQKKGIKTNESPKILALPSDKELEKFQKAKTRELPTLFKTREIIRNTELDMKLTEVEFQADNSKATFYYSADDRVDFRELIKKIASEFKIRVEMKQINLRQEAGMLGGIGVCGRELCCSTWMSGFKNVATSAARYQNLSLNPSKLSGQCGRLKCCLNFELETYKEALKFIPEVKKPIELSQGKARLQKTDIFRKIMWFAVEGDTNWIPLDVDKVKEILEQNQKGIKPTSLADYIEEETIEEEEVTSFEMNKLEISKKKKKKKRKKPSHRPHKPRSNDK